MSDYISRLITRSRAAQPGIRRRSPALYEPLSAESVPSFDRRSNERSYEDPQDEITAAAADPLEASVSEDSGQPEDSELRAGHDPAPKTVFLDKHGRLFSRKTDLPLQRSKENVVNARFESAIHQAFPEESEIVPIIFNTSESEAKPDQEDSLRKLLPPSAWLNPSERLVPIPPSLSARSADSRNQDPDPADSTTDPAAIVSSISGIHSREAFSSIGTPEEGIPEASESHPEKMLQDQIHPGRMPGRRHQNESAFERHARRFLPPEFRHPATPFSSLRQKSAPNSAPSIEIKIDRIEVQAVMPPAASQTKPEPPRRKQSLSLDEYLEQRKGGNR